MLLLDKVASKDQLFKAWDFIKRNKKASPGIDGENVETFSTSLNKNLKDISQLLKTKTYILNKVREKNIPKNKLSTQTRPIKIYTVSDKIVQKSIHLSIQSKFPEIFNEISVGFIPKVSGVSKAVSKIKENFKKNYSVLTSADIMDFFEKINLNKLKEFIYNRLSPDTSLNWILDQCFYPEVIKEDRYTNQQDINFGDTKSGVAQGSVLAPFLSNVYLINFDKQLIKQKIVAIRYADDIAIMSKSIDEAKKNLLTINKLLIKEDLSLHPIGSKKGPTNYQLRDNALYLGLKLHVEKNNSWLISPSKDRIDFNNNILRLLINDNRFPFYKRLEKLNLRLDGWFSTYHFAGCTNKLLMNIYKEMKIILEKEINKILMREKIINHTLNDKQLNFLGVLSLKEISQILSR